MGKELPGVHGADHLPWGPDPSFIAWEDVSAATSGIANVVRFDEGLDVTDEGDGVISVDAAGSSFQPRTHWLQTVDTLTGPGGVGGAVAWASDEGLDTTVLDITAASGTTPTPVLNGWYQAALTGAFSGLTDSDLVEITINIAGAYAPGVPFNGFTAGTVAGSDGTAALHVTVPTLHLTTSDHFVVFVSVGAAGGGTIDYTVDFLVTLMLPGDP